VKVAPQINAIVNSTPFAAHRHLDVNCTDGLSLQMGLTGFDIVSVSPDATSDCSFHLPYIDVIPRP
jgi:hypothetical protein